MTSFCCTVGLHTIVKCTLQGMQPLLFGMCVSVVFYSEQGNSEDAVPGMHKAGPHGHTKHSSRIL